MGRIYRNEPCPCGSGEKYKFCCAVRPKSSHRIAIALVLVFVVAAVWVVARVVRTAFDPDAEAPPGKVWSAEHGHWHDAPGATAGGERPPGPAPVGKVWSIEHGHWHDEGGAEPTAQLPGELP